MDKIIKKKKKKGKKSQNQGMEVNMAVPQNGGIYLP